MGAKRFDIRLRKATAIVLDIQIERFSTRYGKHRDGIAGRLSGGLRSHQSTQTLSRCILLCLFTA